MKLRRIFAGLAATAMAVSTMAVASAATTLEDGTAYIMFADSQWVNQWWDDGNAYDTVEISTVKIEGEGQYTVKATVPDGAYSCEFAALGVTGGETVFGAETLIMTIDSVKADGTEITPNGTAYTSSDDGVCTRVNLYNAWVSDPSTVLDARTADGDLSNISAQAYDLVSLEDWTELEITFTVSFAKADEEPAPEDPAPEDGADKDENPNGGLVGLSVAGLAVAGASVVATKKRK